MWKTLIFLMRLDSLATMNFSRAEILFRILQYNPRRAKHKRLPTSDHGTRSLRIRSILGDPDPHPVNFRLEDQRSVRKRCVAGGYELSEKHQAFIDKKRNTAQYLI